MHSKRKGLIISRNIDIRIRKKSTKDMCLERSTQCELIMGYREDQKNDLRSNRGATGEFLK